MGEQYLSEIRVMSFGFAPKQWAQCNGQLLPVNQNQALFSLIGVTYGGNGTTNFALPNLQGSAPMHVGNNHGLGQVGGSAGVVLTATQNPPHTHSLMASSNGGDSNFTSNNYLASAANFYASSSSLSAMTSTEVSMTGGQPHENRQPFLALNFCIALAGIYPTRN